MMCDYSLHAVKTRPAAVGDKLVTRNFGTGTKGFAPADEGSQWYEAIAVCCLPGTELSFESDIRCGLFSNEERVVPHRTSVFRQIDMEKPRTHHDAIELPDGEQILLNVLKPGQYVTVLQLPVKAAEAKPVETTVPAKGRTEYEDLVLLG